jgi:hypothetical protein
MHVQIHFALSGQTNFRMSGGTFDYREFYYDILKYINSSLIDEERAHILTWYQE